MADSLHPAATHNLPPFITAPGETDVLMVVMSLILVLAVVAFGILFLRLHTLPERIAHKSQKTQFEIVAVLGLIALFTQMHIFWIAGLLLAVIDLPNFGGSLGRIAASTERIADIAPGEWASHQQTLAAGSKPAGEAAAVPLEKAKAAEGNRAPLRTGSGSPAAREKERRHA